MCSSVGSPITEKGRFSALGLELYFSSLDKKSKQVPEWQSLKITCEQGEQTGGLHMAIACLCVCLFLDTQSYPICCHMEATVGAACMRIYYVIVTKYEIQIKASRDESCGREVEKQPTGQKYQFHELQEPIMADSCIDC